MTEQVKKIKELEKKLKDAEMKRENIRIKKRIKEIFASHDEMVGSPNVTADLDDDQDFLSKHEPQRKLLKQCYS